jgi:hypothetical protein
LNIVQYLFVAFGLILIVAIVGFKSGYKCNPSKSNKTNSNEVAETPSDAINYNVVDETENHDRKPLVNGSIE